MNKKSDKTQPLVPRTRLAFFGELTLRVIGGSGISDITVVVTDNNCHKHLLTISKRPGQREHDHAPSERMQEECEPSTEIKEEGEPSTEIQEEGEPSTEILAYRVFSPPEPPLVPSVVPLNAQAGQVYRDGDGCCVYLVRSADLGADPRTLEIYCLGTAKDYQGPGMCHHRGYSEPFPP